MVASAQLQENVGKRPKASIGRSARHPRFLSSPTIHRSAPTGLVVELDWVVEVSKPGMICADVCCVAKGLAPVLR